MSSTQLRRVCRRTTVPSPVKAVLTVGVACEGSMCGTMIIMGLAAFYLLAQYWLAGVRVRSCPVLCRQEQD